MAEGAAATGVAAAGAAAAELAEGAPAAELAEGAPATALAEADADAAGPHTSDVANAAPTITLPPTAGEPDPDVVSDGDDDLGSLIRPAEGTVAKGSEPKHG